MRRHVVIFAAMLLGACGGHSPVRDGPGSAQIPGLPGDAKPRPEARSKYGNGPVYEVFNKRYTVMPSSANYKERGVASWYGKKFHGRLTSNREVYDMYAMTAAHKSLPLPTYVHVRNLRNNKEIVVRVNDRGPFVHNRIIDLSYAAALKLDMIRDGTGLVEVTAINFDSAGQARFASLPTSESSSPQERPVRRTEDTPPQSPVIASQPVEQPKIYVQVGAFGESSNATRRVSMLQQNGIKNAFVFEENSNERRLFRVRIGPVADVVQYDVLVEELENIGITDPYLITE